MKGLLYLLYFSIAFSIFAGVFSIYAGLSNITKGGLHTTLSIANLVLAAACFFMAWWNYNNIKNSRKNREEEKRTEGSI